MNKPYFTKIDPVAANLTRGHADIKLVNKGKRDFWL